MSKVHVLVPFTTKVACGAPHHSIVAAYREKVTCRVCKGTEEYKRLDNLPRRFRRG